MIWRCLCLVFLSLGVLGACSLGLRFEPGYADLDYPGFREAKAEESFSLGPGLLAIARWAISMDEQIDEGERELIQNLRSVRVKTYRLREGAADRIGDSITHTRDALQSEGWTSIVSVRDDASRSAILIRMHEERIQGLVILHADAEEAVFFNIVGDISLQNLTQISRQHLRGESVLASLSATDL